MTRSAADARGGFALRAQPVLSRSAVLRDEPLRLDHDRQLRGWPDARLVVVDPAGRTPVDRDGELGTGSARLRTRSTIGDAPPPDAVLLGEADGLAYWALRVPAPPDDGGEDEDIDRVGQADRPVQVGQADRPGQVGQADGPGQVGRADRPGGQVGQADGSGSWHDLRAVGADLDALGAGLLTTAVAVLNWHDAALFCGRDGSPMRSAHAGWHRHCAAHDHEHYPRTDPAMICLVHDGTDRVLLARQTHWPSARFTVLAGFVDAGESLEGCVAREVHEEVGAQVQEVRYLGSQAWPFPRSLMVAFHALADPDQPLRPADGEIAEARWVSRAELRTALHAGDWGSAADSRLLLPGPVSIARSMLDSWAALDS